MTDPGDGRASVGGTEPGDAAARDGDDAGTSRDGDDEARVPGADDGAGPEAEPLLAVEDLQKHYPITRGILRREVGRIRAVDGVSFDIHRGEAVGLVGESGSGKTTTALSVLGMEEPTGGEVRFEGDRVSELDGEALTEFRRRAQLVVQDPNDAFNPRMTVGEAVGEPLAVHGMDDADRRRRIVEDILERVGLSASDADRYPHEFSGGEKQRIAIARALVLDPDLIVADEPTSALDARVQSDVLGLLADIQRRFDVSVLFVSHDIDTVRRFCDRVAVMYLGEIVEKGTVEEVLSAPAHPYTRVLLGSVPSLDPGERELARPLTDTVPDPSDPPSGCRFHTRCPELIPPDLDLGRDEWHGVATLRFALRTGELPESVDVEAGGVADDERVREAFGLPATLADETVESAVADAIGALDAGDRERAADRLAEALPTVCERETPATVDHDGRTVQCHRYDDAVDAEPLSWSRPGATKSGRQ